MTDSLILIIQAIEDICKKEEIDHRFVGGVSFGGLLNDKTTYEIKLKQNTVILKNHNPLYVFRPDKTVKDIDLITFCSNPDQLIKLKAHITKLKEASQKPGGKQKNFPQISIENTIYYPSKRNQLTQWVTSLEVDKKNNLFLTFDTIAQEIPWESIESWTVVLENKMSYTTRNPIADYYAYQFRSPSGIKPKDKKKVINLEKLAQAIVTKGKEEKIDYQETFSTWQIFIKKLQTSRKIRIIWKKAIIKWYWSTIGETLAHQSGFIANISNQFTGSKQ